ncbi:sugar ABC transporter permease, partial [Sinorhizobium meliloti]
MAAVQDTAVAVGTGASSRPAAQGRLARIWASHGAGYMFLLPWLIGFFGLTLGPAIASLYLSFTNFDLIRAPEWIGTANYARIATADPKFAAAVKVTFLYVVLSVPFKLA